MSLISLCVFLAIPSWPISFNGNVINLNEHHGCAGTNWVSWRRDVVFNQINSSSLEISMEAQHNDACMLQASMTEQFVKLQP